MVIRTVVINLFMRIIIFVVLLVCYNENNAQINVSGKVSDNSKIPLVGAIIQLYSIDTANILHYTLSDINGKWRIDNVKTKDFIISTKYLGYIDYYQSFRGIQKDLIVPDVILLSKDYQLGDITISSNRFDFIIKGDTISYKLDPLRDSTDFYLEDVLKKIPEFEIREDKQIYFKGNKVDKVLVEGKDLYKNRYSFFLQSFAPKDVESVEVIQNFKDIEDRFNNVNDEKTAVNVKLKENSKGIVKIISETAGGYKNKYEHSSNFYYIKNRLGINSFIKANNRGESDLKIIDFVQLQIAKLSKSENIDKLIPLGFQIEEDLVKNNDFIFAGNFEYKLDEKRISRFSILGANLDRFNGSNIDRKFIYSNASIQGDLKKKSIFRLIDAMFSTDLLIGKNLLLNLKSPVRYINSSIDMELYDLESDQDHSINLRGLKQVFYTPSLKLNYKIYDDLSVILDYELEVDKRKFENDYNDFIDNVNNGFTSIFDRRFISNDGTIKLSHKENFLRIDLYHNYNSGNTDIISISEPNFSLLNSNSAITDKINKSGFHFYNKINKIVFSGALNVIEKHKRIIKDSLFESSYFNTNIYLGYEFSQFHSAGLSLSSSDKPFAIDEVSNVAELNDNKIIAVGNIPPDAFSKSKNISLQYFNHEMGSPYLIFSSFQYSKIKNPILYESSFLDNFLVLSKSLGQSSSNFSIQADVRRKLKKRVKMLNLNLNFFSNLTEKSNQESLKLTNIELKLSTDLKLSENFEFKTGYHTTFSNQFFNSTNTRFKEYSPFINFKYNNKRIKIENELNFKYSLVTNSKIFYPAINLNIRFRIYSNLFFYLKGKDLINLNGKKYQTINFSNGYIENRSYIKFPGYLLLGIYYAN
jgi:hypothetical protein